MVTNNLLLFFSMANWFKTSTGSTVINPWTLDKARPVNLSCPVNFRINVLTRFNVVKVRSGVAVETESAASIFDKTINSRKKFRITIIK